MTTAQRVASWARRAAEATAARDQWIRAMRAEGASLRAIGKVAGMTHAGVGRVLDRS